MRASERWLPVDVARCPPAGRRRAMRRGMMREPRRSVNARQRGRTQRCAANLWFNSRLLHPSRGMLRFLLTRVSLIIPTFIGMTLLAFFLIRIVPGDPIETMAGERGIDATRHAALLKEYGLDRPVLVQ